MKVLDLGIEDTTEFQTISKHIQKLLDIGYKNFIIYPYGRNGVLCKYILENQFGILPAAIIDENISRYNGNVKNLECLQSICADKACVVLLNKWNNYEEMLKNLKHIEIDVDIIFKKKEIPISKWISQIPATKIGRYCYGPLAKNNFMIESIGAFCAFAQGVDVVWNHQLDMVTNHDFIYESYCCKEIDNQTINHGELNKRFVIGNDVWLGRNVILTNGVKLGNGVRAAAGAVITKDVPDYACVGGGTRKDNKIPF